MREAVFDSRESGMMGVRILALGKPGACGSGGGCLLVCGGVDSCHCQATGIGIHCRVQLRSGLVAERGSCAKIQLSVGLSHAGLTDSLFVLMQVALSTIMQQSENILFALHSRLLVSAASFIFLTKSKDTSYLFHV